MKHLLTLSLFSSLACGQPYEIEAIPLPKGGVIEVGAIALLPEKKMAISSRAGKIWIGAGCYEEDLTKVEWQLFAEGLRDPIGMFWRDESLWVHQRSGLTRLKDLNDDGKADEVKKHAGGWGIPENSPDLVFGSDPDAHGDTWAVMGVTGPEVKKADWRGWAMKMSKEGRVVPAIPGISSPGGIGYNAVGDLFYTDLQGAWNGSSSLKWLKPDGFMGNPEGNDLAKLAGLPEPPNPESGSRIQIEREKDPRITPPAVIFPHAKFGQSASSFSPDLSDGKFGPFERQIFVGERTNAQLHRVDLEMVNGLYQGAVFPFLEGFGSGLVPVRMGEDGTLFVGGGSRGTKGEKGMPVSLERVRWSGKLPFEIKTMRATPTGFLLRFTEEVDPRTASDPANYAMKAWTYIYQKSHGSPEVDQATPRITAANVSEDGLSVELTVSGRVQGHVHHLNSKGVTSSKGAKLWHADTYYTLNEIPLSRKVEQD